MIYLWFFEVLFIVVRIFSVIKLFFYFKVMLLISLYNLFIVIDLGLRIYVLIGW